MQDGTQSCIACPQKVTIRPSASPGGWGSLSAQQGPTAKQKRNPNTVLSCVNPTRDSGSRRVSDSPAWSTYLPAPCPGLTAPKKPAYTREKGSPRPRKSGHRYHKKETVSWAGEHTSTLPPRTTFHATEKNEVAECASVRFLALTKETVLPKWLCLKVTSFRSSFPN